ncbi:amidohydrolase family protein [Haliangium ochraceum]|uniref:Amidohydrolase 2 n=1 Tax=Haliangium ochraceum (strain DSM 14365 / JCM 11303 / SMP-2) TaxID=502025 RepID=D0LXY8_HALO1|nr:amidohydrolase family protein [Haliangium ochraceum]ACY14343.1 amidohydrolase 2 [Haliangium ochraceum DSM 14365]
MTVIDAHAHFDPRILDVPALLHKLDGAGIDKVVLIPSMNDPLPHTPELLLSVMRRLMSSPLCGCAAWIERRLHDDEGNLRLRGETIRIYSRPDNGQVADLLRAHPERFLGWIFLNPRDTLDPVEELERWREVPGFIGVKLHPHWHGYAIHEALPIAVRCEELGLPILIHLGFGERGAWQVLRGRCPKLRIVFAHAGMPLFARMWRDIRDDPGLYIDLSSPYLSERLARDAVSVCGPERALFGTDAPYGFPDGDHGYDYTHIRGWVERMPCHARSIERMLGGNAERLLAEQRDGA